MTLLETSTLIYAKKTTNTNIFSINKSPPIWLLHSFIIWILNFYLPYLLFECFCFQISHTCYKCAFLFTNTNTHNRKRETKRGYFTRNFPLRSKYFLCEVCLKCFNHKYKYYIYNKVGCCFIAKYETAKIR